MAMSHAGHNHPATPAGRAACRKGLGKVIPGNPPTIVAKDQAQAKRTAKAMDTTITAEDRARGKAAAKITKQHAAARDNAVPEKKIKGDTQQSWRVPLTDIPDGSSLLGWPVYVSEAVRLAWRNGWRTEVGRQWKTDGARSVVIKSTRGDLTIHWTHGGPGITSVVWSSAFGQHGPMELTSMNEGLRLL